MEKIVLGKQAADLCTSTLTQYFVREYFAEGAGASTSPAWSRSTAGGATRWSRAARALPAQATWTEPEGGLFIWATLPEYIDTGDLLAKALREDVAFVPGQAAYVDERGPQLDAAQLLRRRDEEIREGVRRIGKSIAEQVELYGALTADQTAIRSASRGVDRALSSGGGGGGTSCRSARRARGG
jgi:2-aminoadipate transaminase